MSKSLLRAQKVARAFRSPTAAKALVGCRVLAATEHNDAIRQAQANTLIDVGANKGQFSLAFRILRPSAEIIAFEPLSEPANRMERIFANDHAFKLSRLAISESEGDATFHVADRADSSSLLKLGAGQNEAFGVSEARTITVKTAPLETALDLASLKSPVMMKVDVQGAELHVFQGISNWNLIDYIYVELSFVELYTDQPLFHEVYSYLKEKCFHPVGFYNQVSTERFGPTQVDVLFRRL